MIYFPCDTSFVDLMTYLTEELLQPSRIELIFILIRKGEYYLTV